jgi:AraC-like DNA-binding protein
MYEEWPSRLPHATVWRSIAPPGGWFNRILPDGCLDIIWNDGAVFVAGPDTVAETATSPAGARFFALRFADGAGSAVLGVPADELTDRQVPLEDLLPVTVVRPVAEAADPLAALEAAVARRWRPPEREMVALAAAARAGRPVGAIADALGFSARQLQRRCRSSFGYGPKMLARVLRLQRALELARRGQPFADVSATAGYADQAHLSREVKALAGVSLSELMS